MPYSTVCHDLVSRNRPNEELDMLNKIDSVLRHRWVLAITSLACLALLASMPTSVIPWVLLAMNLYGLASSWNAHLTHRTA